MGTPHTSLRVTYYSYDKEFINKIDINLDIDDKVKEFFFDFLILYEKDKLFHKSLGDFNQNEKEIMTIYYDKDSMTNHEDVPMIESNIQSPIDLKKIWLKIRATIIANHKEHIRDNSRIELIDINRKTADFIWSFDCISQLILLLDFAIKEHMLVKITAMDYY